MAGIRVEFGTRFKNAIPNFPKNDREKIRQFITHLQQYGFEGLTGRNKSSDDINPDDPDYLQKLTKVQKHNLWHYHIGIPKYETATNGEQVSEYVLHYCKGDDFIKIVDMSPHPPFILPSDNYLEE